MIIYRKEHRIVFKLIATTLICLFFTNIMWVGPLRAQELNSPIKFTDAGLFEGDLNSIDLPLSYGEIVKTHKGKNGKVVIHIQDAHCNYAAQLRISEIIAHMSQKYDITGVNLEGGAGSYDLSLFADIQDKAVRRKVVDHYVKRGLINGAEYFAINNPGEVTLWGVEDVDLYLTNLNVYRDFLQNAPEVKEHMAAIKDGLNALKPYVYSDELMELERKHDEHDDGAIKLKDYLAYLIEKAGQFSLNIESLKTVSVLSEVLLVEEQIDFKKAGDEREVLIDIIHKKLSKNELGRSIRKIIEFRGKMISEKDFYGYLLGKCGFFKIDLNCFADLRKYIKYISAYGSVDKGMVISEIGVLEDIIRDSMCENERQRVLGGLCRDLTVLEDIFAFSLTREGYKYYRENEVRFSIQKYITFIKEEASRYGIDLDLGSGVRRIDRFRKEALKFYEYSFKRDESFLGNLRFPGKRSKDKAVILVTGGFHAGNLCDLFEKKGFSYVSIVPRFEDEKGYEAPYFQLLANEAIDPVEKALKPVFDKSNMQIASILCPAISEKVWGRANLDRMKACKWVYSKIEGGTPVVIELEKGVIRRFHKEGDRVVVSNTCGSGETPMSINAFFSDVHQDIIDRQVEKAAFSSIRNIEYALDKVKETLLRIGISPEKVQDITRELKKKNVRLQEKQGIKEEDLEIVRFMSGEHLDIDGHVGGYGIRINAEYKNRRDGLTREGIGVLIHEVVADLFRDHGLSDRVQQAFLTDDYSGIDTSDIRDRRMHEHLWILTDAERREAKRDFAETGRVDAKLVTEVPEIEGFTDYHGIIDNDGWRPLELTVSFMKEILDSSFDPNEEYYSGLFDDPAFLSETEKMFSRRGLIPISRLDTYIEKQSLSKEQAIIELIANAQDASSVDRAIGRFGVGAYQMFNEIKGRRDSIVVTTSTDGVKGIRLTFRRRQGRLVYKAETVTGGIEKGTRIEVNRKLNEEERISREDHIEKKLKANARGPIIVNGKQINLANSKRYRYINGDVLKMPDIALVEVMVTDKGYTVVDRGTGMDAKVVFEKYLVPKGSTKPYTGAPVENDFEARSETRMFYSGVLEEEGEGSVTVQVSGVGIVTIPIFGINVPEEMIIELPHDVWLPESRDGISLDDPVTRKGIVTVMEKLTDPKRDIPASDRYALINGLALLVDRLTEESEDKSLQHELRRLCGNIIRDEDTSGKVIVPNRKQFESLKLTATSEAIYLDESLFNFRPDRLPGVKRVRDFISKTHALYVADLDISGEEDIFFEGWYPNGKGWIILDRTIWEKHRNDPWLINFLFNFTISYGDKGRELGRIVTRKGKPGRDGQMREAGETVPATPCPESSFPKSSGMSEEYIDSLLRVMFPEGEDEDLAVLAPDDLLFVKRRIRGSIVSGEITGENAGEFGLLVKKWAGSVRDLKELFPGGDIPDNWVKDKLFRDPIRIIKDVRLLTEVDITGDRGHVAFYHNEKFYVFSVCGKRTFEIEESGKVTDIDGIAGLFGNDLYFFSEDEATDRARVSIRIEDEEHVLLEDVLKALPFEGRTKLIAPALRGSRIVFNLIEGDSVRELFEIDANIYKGLSDREYWKGVDGVQIIEDGSLILSFGLWKLARFYPSGRATEIEIDDLERHPGVPALHLESGIFVFPDGSFVLTGEGKVNGDKKWLASYYDPEGRPSRVSIISEAGRRIGNLSDIFEAGKFLYASDSSGGLTRFGRSGEMEVIFEERGWVLDHKLLGDDLLIRVGDDPEEVVRNFDEAFGVFMSQPNIMAMLDDILGDEATRVLVDNIAGFIAARMYRKNGIWHVGVETDDEKMSPTIGDFDLAFAMLMRCASIRAAFDNATIDDEVPALLKIISLAAERVFLDADTQIWMIGVGDRGDTLLLDIFGQAFGVLMLQCENIKKALANADTDAVLIALHKTLIRAAENMYYEPTGSLWKVRSSDPAKESMTLDQFDKAFPAMEIQAHKEAEHEGKADIEAKLEGKADIVKVDKNGGWTVLHSGTLSKMYSYDNAIVIVERVVEEGVPAGQEGIWDRKCKVIRIESDGTRKVLAEIDGKELRIVTNDGNGGNWSLQDSGKLVFSRKTDAGDGEDGSREYVILELATGMIRIIEGENLDVTRDIVLGETLFRVERDAGLVQIPTIAEILRNTGSLTENLSRLREYQEKIPGLPQLIEILNDNEAGRMLRSLHLYKDWTPSYMFLEEDAARNGITQELNESFDSVIRSTSDIKRIREVFKFINYVFRVIKDEDAARRVVSQWLKIYFKNSDLGDTVSRHMMDDGYEGNTPLDLYNDSGDLSQLPGFVLSCLNFLTKEDIEFPQGTDAQKITGSRSSEDIKDTGLASLVRLRSLFPRDIGVRGLSWETVLKKMRAAGDGNGVKRAAAARISGIVDRMKRGIGIIDRLKGRRKTVSGGRGKSPVDTMGLEEHDLHGTEREISGAVNAQDKTQLYWIRELVQNARDAIRGEIGLNVKSGFIGHGFYTVFAGGCDEVRVTTGNGTHTYELILVPEYDPKGDLIKVKITRMSQYDGDFKGTRIERVNFCGSRADEAAFINILYAQNQARRFLGSVPSKGADGVTVLFNGEVINEDGFDREDPARTIRITDGISEQPNENGYYEWVARVEDPVGMDLYTVVNKLLPPDISGKPAQLFSDADIAEIGSKLESRFSRNGFNRVNVDDLYVSEIDHTYTRLVPASVLNILANRNWNIGFPAGTPVPRTRSGIVEVERFAPWIAVMAIKTLVKLYLSEESVDIKGLPMDYVYSNSNAMSISSSVRRDAKKINEGHPEEVDFERYKDDFQALAQLLSLIEIELEGVVTSLDKIKQRVLEEYRKKDPEKVSLEGVLPPGIAYMAVVGVSLIQGAIRGRKVKVGSIIKGEPVIEAFIRFFDVLGSKAEVTGNSCTFVCEFGANYLAKGGRGRIIWNLAQQELNLQPFLEYLIRDKKNAPFLDFMETFIHENAHTIEHLYKVKGIKRWSHQAEQDMEGSFGWIMKKLITCMIKNVETPEAFEALKEEFLSSCGYSADELQASYDRVAANIEKAWDKAGLMGAASEDQFHEGKMENEKTDELVYEIASKVDDIEDDVNDQHAQIFTFANGEEVVVEINNGTENIVEIGEKGKKLRINADRVRSEYRRSSDVSQVIKVVIIHELAECLGIQRGYAHNVRHTASLALEGSFAGRSLDIREALTPFWRSRPVAYGSGDTAGTKAVAEDVYEAAKKMVGPVSDVINRDAPTFIIAPAFYEDISPTSACDRDAEKMLGKGGHSVCARHYEVGRGGDWRKDAYNNALAQVKKTLPDLNDSALANHATRMMIRVLSPDERTRMRDDIKQQLEALNKDAEHKVDEKAVEYVLSKVHIVVEEIQGAEHLNPVIDLFVDMGMMEVDRYTRGDYNGDIPFSLKKNLSDLLRLSVTNLDHLSPENLLQEIEKIFKGNTILMIKAIDWKSIRKWKDANDAVLRSL